MPYYVFANKSECKLVAGYRIPGSRKQEILAYVRSGKEMHVASLAAALRVSPQTIRRDLTALEREGIIKRVYGGALPTALPRLAPVMDRLQVAASEKIAVARIAAGLVQDIGTDGEDHVRAQLVLQIGLEDAVAVVRVLDKKAAGGNGVVEKLLLDQQGQVHVDPVSRGACRRAFNDRWEDLPTDQQVGVVLVVKPENGTELAGFEDPVGIGDIIGDEETVGRIGSLAPHDLLLAKPRKDASDIVP